MAGTISYVYPETTQIGKDNPVLIASHRVNDNGMPQDLDDV